MQIWCTGRGVSVSKKSTQECIVLLAQWMVIGEYFQWTVQSSYVVWNLKGALMAGMKLLSVDDIMIWKYCNATLGNPSVDKTIEYAPQTQSNAILEHIKLRSMQNNAKQCHPPPNTLSAPHSFHLQRESYFLPPRSPTRSSATRFPEWGHQRVWVFTNSADQDHVSKTTQPLLPFSPTSRWWWGLLSWNFLYDVHCSGAPQHCLSQERVRQEGPVLANTMVNTQEVLSNSMINTEGEWLQLIERMLSWSWDCKTLIPNISQRLSTRTFLRSWRMSPSPTAGRPSSNVKWTTSGTTRSVLICKRFHHLKPFIPHKDFPLRIWNWKTFCQGLKKCSND